MTAVFKSVDPAKNTITITVQKDGGASEDRTFDVSKEVTIALAGAENAKLTDLKAGMRLTLKLTADRKTVVGIKENKGEGKDKE